VKKFFVVSIPIVTLGLFILIMVSGNYLKRPLGNDDNIPALVEVINNNIMEEKWEKASTNTEKLNDAWEKVIKRIQFSSERDEINAFTMNVARLRGAIRAQDKAISLSELSEAFEHWKQLGK